MPQPRELLKATDIEAMEAVASLHPLNPNALRLRKSLGDLAHYVQTVRGMGYKLSAEQ